MGLNDEIKNLQVGQEIEKEDVNGEVRIFQTERVEENEDGYKIVVLKTNEVI